MATTTRKADLNVYIKAVLRLIRAGARDNLRKVVAKAHPADLAKIIEQLSRGERQDFLLLILREGKLGSTLAEMYEGLRLEILRDLDDEMISRLLSEMSSDDAADLLEALPEERIKRILDLIRDGFTRRQIMHLLSFGSTTAGGIMQTEYLALPETETVSNAVGLIRRRYRDTPIFYLYTLDDERRLSGVVSFRQLLLAQDHWTLGEIANRHVVKVRVDEDQEKVANLFYRYDLLAVPVVDSKNHLVGIITVDDVMDVIEEEVSEDIYKLAGSNVQEMLYGNKILKISKVRLPWLLVSVCTGLVTAGIIGLFDQTLKTVIVLASFIPVITGMSGNVGTQSTAITVRGLALGRITARNFFSTLFREMSVGLTLGLICGFLVAVIGYLVVGNIFLGVVIAVSMTLGMTIAATMATLMPLLFAKTGIDPAVSSGPLITTLNDCISVSIYLSTATLLLRYLS